MNPAAIRPWFAAPLALALAISSIPHATLAGSQDAAALAGPVATSGQWFLDPSSDTGTVRLSFRITGPRDHDHWGSRKIPIAKIEGLTAAALAGGAADVSLRVTRDAGTITLDGRMTRGRGAGTFDLVLDPRFARELEKRGVGRPTEAQQVKLALADADYALLDEVKAQGYETTDVALFVLMADHGVNLEYVRGMGALGHRLGTLPRLVAARDHGVDPEFAQSLAAAGYRDLSFDTLLRARDHGVDQDYVAEIRGLGYGDLSLDELVRIRDHGVDAGYVRALREAGYPKLPIARLVEARDHGVDPEFLADMAEAGYGRETLSDLIRARDHGVDGYFARRAARKLGARPTLDDLIGMRDRGEIN